MEAILTFMLYMLVVISVSFLVKQSLQQQNKNLKNILFFIAILLCSLLAAFRENVGTDSAMYRRAYEYGEQTLNRWVDFENGYVFLMNSLHKFHIPYQGLFFCMEFLTTLFIFLTIKREKDNISIFLATFIYMIDMYFFSWNVMRQALAIAICVYAMSIFLDGEKLKSILLIIFACQFHYSAALCLAIIGAKIVFDNRNSKILMAIVFMVAMILVLNRPLLGSIVKMITGSGYYTGYITRDEYTDSNLFRYFLKISPILIITFFNFKNYFKNRKYLVYFGIMICGYIISSLSSQTNTQVARLGYYFTYLNMFVLGYCGKQRLFIGKKFCLTPKSVRILCYFYFIIMFLYGTFYRGFSQLVPYSLFI